MIDEEATFEKFGYHSRNLSPKSRKKIVAVCDDCGKVWISQKSKYKALCHSCVARRRRKKVKCLVCGKSFEVIPSKLENGRGICCSKECADLARRKGKMGKCLQCGKDIYIPKSKEANKHGNFCCDNCVMEWRREKFLGKDNPIYKKITKNCLVCGKEFYTYEAQVKKGLGKFCSSRCALKAIPSSQTKPELIFADISKKNEIPSEYTGDKSLWIGRINPDFVYYNGRKRYAIFINGDYWHSPFLRPNMRETQRPEYQIKTCKENKWIPMLIWESDLKREDAEAFCAKPSEEGRYLSMMV